MKLSQITFNRNFQALSADSIYDENFGIIYNREYSTIHLYSHKIENNIIRTINNPCTSIREEADTILNVR